MSLRLLGSVPVVSHLVGWPAISRCERHPQALAEVWEQSWEPPLHWLEVVEQGCQRMVEEDQGEVEVEGEVGDLHLRVQGVEEEEWQQMWQEEEEELVGRDNQRGQS